MNQVLTQLHLVLQNVFPLPSFFCFEVFFVCRFTAYFKATSILLKTLLYVSKKILIKKPTQEKEGDQDDESLNPKRTKSGN